MNLSENLTKTLVRVDAWEWFWPAGRASFTLLDDDSGYVMLEGPVTYDEEYDFELELVGTGMRYNPESGEDYVRSTYMNEGKPWPGIVLWRIKPESWLSYDSTATKAS